MSVLKPAKEVVILRPILTQNVGGLPIKVKQSLSNVGSDRMPEFGEVVAIGKGKKPVEFKIGDIIYYEKYLDNTISAEGETFNFIRFPKILGVKPK